MRDARKNFGVYFPSLAKQMTAILNRGYDEYVIYLDDGGSLIYNDFEHTIRRSPVNSRNMTEEESMREFGERLRLIMYRKRITQEDLSIMTGIPRSMISCYMTGRNMPSFHKVDKIAKALDCSTDDLRFV